MKRKFNFYCILLLIAVAFSLFTAAQHFVEGFNSGYADATLEFQDRATGKTCKPYILDLRSHNPARRELAMTNTMTGNTDSLRVSKVTAWVVAEGTGSTPVLVTIGNMLVLLAMSGCCLAFWVVFIRLMLAVNRGEDFGESATRRLRLMGWYIIAIYLGEWLLLAFDTTPAVAYAGYDVSLHSEIDSMLLVIGLGLLMVSQLFAVGQKMKEENDLTI